MIVGIFTIRTRDKGLKKTSFKDCSGVGIKIDEYVLLRGDDLSPTMILKPLSVVGYSSKVGVLWTIVRLMCFQLGPPTCAKNFVSYWTRKLCHN